MNDLERERLVVPRLNCTAEKKTEKTKVSFKTSFPSSESIRFNATAEKRLKQSLIKLRGTWRSACRQSWGRPYTQWKSTSWVPEPKPERSHLGSASSCPARENLLKSITLIWDLFWVGVEPLGQPELSLPTEEENKLDRHHKVFSFSCTEYNLLSCFFFFRNSWEGAWCLPAASSVWPG